MSRSTDDRVRAFYLYCEGVPQDRIAKAIGSGTRTIATWIKKYDWKKSRENLAPIVKENNKTSTDKLNEELLKSIKKVWVDMVRDGKAKAQARDVLEVIKTERLLTGKSTENVSMSSEVNIVDAYQSFLKKKKDDELSE